MQFTLTPQKEHCSLLQFARRLCPAETAAFETAKAAISPPAEAQRPRGDRRNIVGDDAPCTDDYGDDYDSPSDPSSERTHQEEMKAQVDIAEGCLQTIVGAITQAACASACEILRKGKPLPPSYFGQAAGQKLLKGEVQAELYDDWQVWWHRGRRVTRKNPSEFRKGNIAVVLATAVTLTVQEHTSGDARNYNAAAEHNSPDSDAPPSKKPRRNKKQPFLVWYKKQPEEVRSLGSKPLAKLFQEATGASINEVTVRRARQPP
ncbi:hypothetical protein BH10PSE6_BH10PSE6_11660 [soil metagenome]